jgi:hypothetical protein
MLEIIGIGLLVLLLSPFIVATLVGLGIAALALVGAPIALIIRIIRG